MTATLAAAALTLTACGGGASSVASSAAPLEATLITRVAPEGLTVVAVALEYDRVLSLAPDGAQPSDFAVEVEFDAAGEEALSGVRTVTAVRTGAVPDAEGAPADGRYVILELEASEPTAAASYVDWSTTITHGYALEEGYSISQVGDLESSDGHVVAASDAAVPVADVTHEVVDDFTSATFASDAGPALPYRALTPETPAPTDGYPLVVTLHGYGDSGDDNLGQLTGNQIATAFADEARQRTGPAYVLSPQADPSDPAKGAWWDPSMQDAVVELIEDFIASHPDVDASRVYLTGLSMGSYGSWAILEDHADLFAGAVLVCGGGIADVAAAAAALTEVPIWAVHSEDDAVVAYDAEGSDLRAFQAFQAAGTPVVWSAWDGLLPDARQESLARDAVAQAERTGSTHLFTTIEADTTPGFNHQSWIPTYANDVILDWLLAQDRDG
ncbi:PHB depolymerase family esterase [Demequina iriomotensis]|uniref:PHB depolymerase family esterase n=1 Tax=Demequina iriomotensis TaxID=1536641 RepID=UPI0007833552|nr:PHB depolymerase family esterase [Demequina iriomotensis]